MTHLVDILFIIYILNNSKLNRMLSVMPIFSIIIGRWQPIRPEVTPLSLVVKTFATILYRVEQHTIGLEFFT